MTKDEELHSSTWKSMKQAITGLTENVTVSSSGYGNYTNPESPPSMNNWNVFVLPRSL